VLMLLEYLMLRLFVVVGEGIFLAFFLSLGVRLDCEVGERRWSCLLLVISFVPFFLSLGV